MKFTEEQLNAIKKRGSNILISAGAGSGKTAVLSERVLEHVKEGTSISNLLVLTFTNLAAAEMKARIRKKIKSDNALKEEYEKLETSYITTFDSFCYSVVKKYHYLLKLPANIKITDESILKVKKEELLNNLFDRYYETEDNNFKKILKEYFLKDDKQLKDFILNTYEKMNLIYDKEDFLNNYINNFYSDSYIEKLINDYMFVLKTKMCKIDYLLEEISFENEDYYSKINYLKEIPRETYEDIKSLSKVKLPDLPRGSSDDLKIYKPELKNELDSLLDLTKYESLEELKEEYVSLKDLVNNIINIIKDFDKLYAGYKYSEHLFNFLDIEKSAIDIVKNFKEARDYYKSKFIEILIDEYQDTSDIQEIFISLISDNNVYMVGDIKQSIYKFRNANPYIFKEKFDKYGREEEGTRIDLNKNFRSNEYILKTINNIFNIVMDEYIGEANYRLEHNLVYGNKLYDELDLNKDGVELLSYELEKDYSFRKDEVEVFIIANDIKDKIDKKIEIYDDELKIKRAIKYKDITILLDRSTNFDLYKKVFEYLKIPLVINKDVSLNDNVNIKVIKNILNLINKIYKKEFDNSFKRSFYSVGRSFLFEYKDDYLYEVFVNNSYKNTNLYNEILYFVNLLEEKSIYELLKNIIYKFNFYENFIKIGDINNNNASVEYILKLAKDNENIYSVDDFINYLSLVIEDTVNLNYKTSNNKDGVNLMTIHGSKGLEFPVLYVASLDKGFNFSDVNERFIFDKEYGFILPVAKDNLKTLFTKRVLKERYIKEELSERIRLFYVALTRARERLIIISNASSEKEDKSIEIDKIKSKSQQDFLNFASDNIKNKKTININELNITNKYKYSKKEDLKKLYQGNKKLVVRELSYELEKEERKTFSKKEFKLFSNNIKENLSFGNKIHFVLEQIDFKSPNIEDLTGDIKEYIDYFINLDILKKGINYYKEYDFMYENNNEVYRGSIDLLIEKEEEYVIIDYKLKQIDDEDYYNQLRGYKNYIENITNKPTRIYLYSIINKKLKEVN